MLGKQQTVDEQPQLAVGELAFQIKIRTDDAFLGIAGFGVGHHTHRFAVFDVVAAIHQVGQVAADRFAIGGHIVFVFQNIGNVLLTQPVFFVRVLAQNIQNVDNQQLFGLFCIHVRTPYSLWHAAHRSCP